MPAPELVIDYTPRAQFAAFHHRTERFACIVTHRRAGKTVACIHDLQLGATRSNKIRPRFAYLSPFLKQSKTVAWDYLRAAMRRDAGEALGPVVEGNELSARRVVDDELGCWHGSVLSQPA